MTTYSKEFNFTVKESLLLRELLFYFIGQFDTIMDANSDFKDKDAEAVYCKASNLRYDIYQIIRDLDDGTHIWVDLFDAVVLEEKVAPLCEALSKTKRNKADPLKSGIDFILARYSNDVIVSLGEKLKSKEGISMISTNSFLASIAEESKKETGRKSKC